MNQRSAVPPPVILSGAERSRRTSNYSVGGGGAERMRPAASAREKLEVLRLRPRPPAPAGDSAQDDSSLGKLSLQFELRPGGAR